MEARVNTEGEFRLGPLATGRHHVELLGSGSRLDMRADREGTQSIDLGDVEIGDGKPLRLVVDETRAGYATLTVRAGGRAMPYATVHLTEVAGEGRDVELQTDERGVVRFGPLAPREVRLTVSDRIQGWTYRADASVKPAWPEARETLDIPLVESTFTLHEEGRAVVHASVWVEGGFAGADASGGVFRRTDGSGSIRLVLPDGPGQVLFRWNDLEATLPIADRPAARATVALKRR